MTRIFSAVFLATVMFSAPFFQLPFSVRAQSSTIPISQEYASGDLQVPYYGGGNLRLWYSWVNVNNTHTVFFALHFLNQNPIFTFVGQAYNSSTGQRVFVGNSLLALEVYNDTDHNGYLDADYSIPATELKYTLIMNASQTFTTDAVNKTIVDGVPHYQWGVTYGSIQAFLIKATPPGYGYGGGGSAANALVDHVSMFYDYSIKGNRTFLKTSFQIGSITLSSFTTPTPSLQGLSLSLLYATSTVAARQLTVVTGGSPYDSQSSPVASTFTAAQVNVDNILAYAFQFKDNYTLQTSSPTTHPAVYLASPIGSIPTNALQGQFFDPLLRVQDFVRGQLPDIAGLPSTSNINYTATRFLYRINYPTWSGTAILHDPTYVAYLGKGTGFTNPIPVPSWILYTAAFTGGLALAVAFNGLRRARKPSGPTDAQESIEIVST